MLPPTLSGSPEKTDIQHSSLFSPSLSKSYQWNRMHLGGKTYPATRNNRLGFVKD